MRQNLLVSDMKNIMSILPYFVGQISWAHRRHTQILIIFSQNSAYKKLMKWKLEMVCQHAMWSQPLEKGN